MWSAEGQGSTFTLRLPEAGAARDRDRLRSQPSESSESWTNTGADLDGEDHGRPYETFTNEPLSAPEVLP
ncbi:Sensor-like histidine kinase SenX3 OS=Streptomyces antimycoticus OX=68175 GN=SANT12839_045430 PE=4 SV=1 [Streptomyces antimycoticus]